jgi:hypothetical protein
MSSAASMELVTDYSAYFEGLFLDPKLPAPSPTFHQYFACVNRSGRVSKQRLSESGTHRVADLQVEKSSVAQVYIEPRTTRSNVSRAAKQTEGVCIAPWRLGILPQICPPTNKLTFYSSGPVGSVARPPSPGELDPHGRASSELLRSVGWHPTALLICVAMGWALPGFGPGPGLRLFLRFTILLSAQPTVHT